MKKEDIIEGICFVAAAVIVWSGLYFLAVGQDSSFNKEPDVSIPARIDFLSTDDPDKPHFKVYVNDNTESEPVADWMMQAKTPGYQVETLEHKSNMKLTADQDTTVQITLRGPWKQDVSGKLKELWVDYTNMIIDGQKIVDQRTPAWHNQGIGHTVWVQKGKTYTVQIEWQPHE